MLQKHFTKTKRLLKLLNSKKNRPTQFCEHCLCENPETTNGYTDCCNERTCDSYEALANAKREDVQRFLDSKFTVSSQLIGNVILFELPKKKVGFSINLGRAPMEEIIREIKNNTKGLRKEF